MFQNLFDDIPMAGQQPPQQPPQQPMRRPRIQGPEREPTPLYPEQRALNQQQVETEELRQQRMRQQIANPTPPTPLSEQQRAALSGRLTAMDGFEQGLNELEGIYQESFQGDRAGILGMGGGRNVAGYLGGIRQANPRFSSSSRRLLGYIAQAMGITSQQANTPHELEMRFGPYLPNPTDTDAQIEDKLRSLREMLETQRNSLRTQLGVEAPPPAAPSSDRMDTTTQQVTAAGQGGRTELSRGDQQIDPAQQAMSEQIRTRLSSMLKGGVADAAVRRYAIEQGISPQSIDEVLQYRRTPQWREWRRQRPNEAVRFRDETLNVQMDPLAGMVAGAAASPPGTAVAHAGNAATAGTMPLWGQALGGDSEQIRLGLDATRRENPMSALLGDVGGAALTYGAGGATASAVGRGLAERAPRLASFLQTPGQFRALTPRAVAGDAAYGGLQGMGENADPLSGIAENVIGGAGGRGAMRTAGRALAPSGGNIPDLYAMGVRPSPGQRFGGVVNGIEQRLQDVPLVGDAIRGTRNRARQQFQTGLFNDALEQIGSQLPRNVRSGPQAHAFAQREFDRVYDSARSGMTFRLDGEFTAELGALQQTAGNLRPESQRVFDRVWRSSVVRRMRGGELSGDDYKRAVSEVGRHIRRIRGNQSGDGELASALQDMQAALDRGARRHSPAEAVAALDAADAGYARLVRIEDAARRRGGEMGEFSPAQYDAAVQNMSNGIRGREYISGRSLNSNLAEQGRSLSDTIPDSGTPARMANMVGVNAAATGGAMLDPATLALLGMTGGAYAPGARNLLTGIFAPRQNFGRRIRDNARFGGMTGAPLVSYGSGRE